MPLTTPAVIVALLMFPMWIGWILARSRLREFHPSAFASIGLGWVFLFTGLGHFLMTVPMSEMLPPWVPARIGIIYATGVLELALGVVLFIPKARRLAGWIAVLFLIAVFPANVYASLIRHPMGGGDWGLLYLLVRAPLQVLLIGWAWYFLIRRPVRPLAPA
jgi:uncharacterized membrane protein